MIVGKMLGKFDYCNPNHYLYSVYKANALCMCTETNMPVLLSAIQSNSDFVKDLTLPRFYLFGTHGIHV